MNSIAILIKEIIIKVLIFLINSYYYFFKKDYYNRYHLDLAWENGRLQFSCYHHDEYVLYKQAELSRLQKEVDPGEFISLAIREANQCNFIIFDCGDEKRFVQFWLGDNELMSSWPIIKKNKLGKYLYPMLGVLNELDITQRPTKVGGLIRTKYQYYEVKQEKDFKDYQIHFADNIDEATKFTTIIFTKVFKQDLEKMRFNLG